MQFHKKLGVFEACKKVCDDFFDTLKKGTIRRSYLLDKLIRDYCCAAASLPA